MTTLILPPTLPTSVASACRKNDSCNPIPYRPTEWDDKIVEATKYQSKSDLFDDGSIASDSVSNDLSDLEKAIQGDMSGVIPCEIQRTYTSSDSEISVEDKGELIDSQDNLPTINYATFAENGVYELMRYGMYKPDGEPVHGILNDPRQQPNDNIYVRTNEEKLPTADLDGTLDDGDILCSRLVHLLSRMNWSNDESRCDDDASSQASENHKGIRQSQSCSSHGSTVVAYEGPRILSRMLDVGEIETLPDSDYDGGDIETLDSGDDYNYETSSEPYYGEVVTLDDSDDNSLRMFDEALLDGETEVERTAADKGDFIGSTTTMHESNTVSENTRKSSFNGDTAWFECYEGADDPNLNIPCMIKRLESILKISDKDIEIQIACEKSNSEKMRRSKEDTRRTKVAGKKFFRLKKIKRMMKS